LNHLKVNALDFKHSAISSFVKRSYLKWRLLHFDVSPLPTSHHSGGSLMNHILSHSLVLSLCLLLSLPAMLGACSRAPKYEITLSAENFSPGISASTLMTATVTQKGVAAIGQNVAFTWTIEGGSPQSGSIVATNAVGQATYMLENIDTQPRKITVTAFLPSEPKVTATADVRFVRPPDLPGLPGFIALSKFGMNWSAAKDWCQQHGGRLPLIDGSASLGSVLHGAAIDGFGSFGAGWPSGLPDDLYWTGTGVAGSPGSSWLVYRGFGRVDVGLPISEHRVVCVP
jgi:hypothetical protein